MASRGQRIEDAADLYFYNSRWYDPVVGRFLQADAVVPAPGNPQSLNRHAYVLNNPLRYTDPSGHSFAIDAEGDYRQGPNNELLLASMEPELARLMWEMKKGHASAQTRLAELNEATRILVQVPLMPFLRFHLPLNTSGIGSVIGDKSFRSAFRDSEEGYISHGLPPYTRQVGHFLTAVVMGGNFSPIADPAFQMAITAHEMTSDKPVVAGIALQLLLHSRRENAMIFRSAVSNFEAGDYAAMEVDIQKLWAKSSKGVGNSKADIRLSVAGYSLGRQIRSGAIQTNAQMAWWVMEHIVGY